MATSRPQLSLAGNKRSVDDFEHDEEHGATASEPKRPCIRRMGEEAGRPVQSASRRVQSQVQRTGTQDPQSLDDFPPIEQPLPANISLFKLCWSFPNHLVGENLVRFIKADWSARSIYLQMQPAARSGLAVEKPWEVLQARLDKIKGEMPEDQGLNTEAATLTPGFPQHMNEFSEGSEDEEIEEEGGAEETLQTKPRLSVSELFDLVQGEVQKQRGFVFDTLGSLSSTEAEERWRAIWNSRARQWESAFMATEKLNEDGIPPAKSTMCGRTLHQLALLKKMVQRNHQPPTETDSKEQSLYNDTLTQCALENQLEILKGWSEGFKKQQLAPGPHRGEQNKALPEDGSSKSVLNSKASRGASSRWAHGLHATTPEREYESFGDGKLETVPHLNQTRAHGGCDSPGSLTDLNKRVDRNRHTPSNSGRAHSLQKDDQMNQVRKAAPSPQHTWQGHHDSSHMAKGGVPHENNIWVPSNAFGQPGALPTLAAVSGGYHQNPFQDGQTHGQAHASSQTQSSTSISNSQLPTNAFLQQATVQNSSAPLAIKKRGAPRKIFFTSALPADTPLPASLTDDQILRRYPEHLQKTDVMRRFVATSGSRGYPTKDMVAVLSHHRIAGDENGSMTQEERLKKIKNWVIKERDSCNKDLKSARDSNSQPGSAATTPAPAQVSLQAQAPATTITTSVAPPSLQTPSSMLTTYVPPQVGLQAHHNIVASPNHTALTYAPSSWNIGSLPSPFDMTQDWDLVPPSPHPILSHPSMGIDDDQELFQSWQDPNVGQYTEWRQDTAAPGLKMDSVATDEAVRQDGTNWELPAPDENDENNHGQDPDIGPYTRVAEWQQETAAPGLKMDPTATDEAARQDGTQWELSALDEQDGFYPAWNEFDEYFATGSSLPGHDPAPDAEATQGTMTSGLPPLHIGPLFPDIHLD